MIALTLTLFDTSGDAVAITGWGVALVILCGLLFGR